MKIFFFERALEHFALSNPSSVSLEVLHKTGSQKNVSDASGTQHVSLNRWRPCAPSLPAFKPDATFCACASFSA
jgi:hypothetical protein